LHFLSPLFPSASIVLAQRFYVTHPTAGAGAGATARAAAAD
jgi:hypothetical protein